MDREEFTSFYATSFPRLVGQLYAMTGDQAEAHPSAIPSGAGVQFVVSSNVGYFPQPNVLMDLWEWLVQASPQCTGS